MATDINTLQARVIAATQSVPAADIEEAMQAATADQDKTLVDFLLEKKKLDPEIVDKIRKNVESIKDAPDIVGHTITAKLGEGGMGAVYKARDNMGRTVALKLLPSHFAKNPQFVERFYREARSSALLDHPNVVRGYNVGESNGTHFFSMEFVDGESVKDTIDRHKKLPIGDAVKIVRDVALALEQAAEQKIVHRDIKPDNIMLTLKGIVKLADLGLAKQMDDESGMTQTGSGFGTPYYMPPEQARNAKYVDGRSDIYALGITLYKLLTGRVPFDGSTPMEVLLAKEDGKYPSARSLNPDVPSSLSLLIDKMIAKDPNHRQQSAAELVQEFDRLGLHNDVLSFIDHEGAAPPAAKSTATSKTPSSPPKSAARSAAATPTAVGGPVKRTPSKPSTNPPTSDLWFLKFKDRTGKLIKTKMPQSRVVHMIKNNQLDESVEASQSPDGPFRRLAAFGEFEPLLRGKIAARKVEQKTAASATTNKMSSLIENFDKEQKAHKFRKNIKETGWFLWSIVLTLAILGGGGFAFWVFVLKPAVEGTQKISQESKEEREKNAKWREGK